MVALSCVGDLMMVLKDDIEKIQQPVLVVVMGVSGSGKSTLAEQIANQLEFTFLDADNFHSIDAVKQMSQGIALTDAQRQPWIERICQQLSHFELLNKSCVLAYSGLRQKHRQLIFSSYPYVVGILINAEQALLAQRLSNRKAHFMSPQLLTSQITSMEDIKPSEQINLLTLNAAEPVEQLLSESIRFIAETLN
jgi:gluconokinase